MPQRYSPSFLLSQEHSRTNPSSPHLFCEHHHLIAKERATHSSSHTLSLRPQVVRWISTVSKLFRFSALTSVLAVNYFDRFTTNVTFESAKPWISHLAAVTCLSLAAKMEETRLPLLLDLQESKFVFEAKTIQRMELIVLSTLEWKMNPVTPISFFQHVVTRLGLNSRLHREFLCRCERLLLSVIADSRVMSYLPSILAAAIMIRVIKEIEPFNALEYRKQLLRLLKSSEEQVNECYKLLVRCGDIHNLPQKRRGLSEPSSQGGVIDASFSCDSSNDSPISVSVEPLFKKSKAQDRHMSLPSVNRMSVDVLSSPR